MTVSIRFFGVVPGVGRTRRDNFMNLLKTLPRNLESSLRHEYPFQAIPRATNDVEIREPIFERRILTVAGQME